MASGVRLARTPDVDRVGAITVASWHGRLGGLVSPEVLAGLDAGDIAMAWASALINPPSPRHRLLVAVEQEASELEVVVGYAAVGPSADPDADAATAELLALEVEPVRQRHGHGSRLMAAAIDVARTAGAESASTWLPLEDTGRRAFLQSAGWAPDSAYRDVEVGTADHPRLLREIRLVASLLDD